MIGPHAGVNTPGVGLLKSPDSVLDMGAGDSAAMLKMAPSDLQGVGD